MFIIRHRNWFFALTGIIVLLSIVSLFLYGLHESIDFTGGTLIDVTYPAGRPSGAVVEQALNAAGFSDYELQELSTNDYNLRAGALTSQQETTLTTALSGNGQYPSAIVSLDEVGPTIGAQLKSSSIEALA